MAGTIDAVFNLFTPEVVASRPAWTREFHKKRNSATERVVKGVSVDETLRWMDEVEVERALVIAAKLGRRGLPGSWELDPQIVARVVKDHPDRFSGLVGINPFDGLRGVKELERLIVDEGFVGAHLYPHWFEMAPDHARYYPFYTKCAELGVPIQIQVGYCRNYAPEQRLESVGRPITLDTIACHLPELKIVGIHVGWPWTDEMLSVAEKHDNVYIGADRHAPSRWPSSLVDYINTIGSDKVVFGTDFPALDWDKAFNDLKEVAINEDSRRKLMGDNARQLYGLS